MRFGVPGGVFLLATAAMFAAVHADDPIFPDWPEIPIQNADGELATRLDEHWVPIARERYERFREATLVHPAGDEAEANRPHLDRVVYEARFANDALVDGRMTAEVRVPRGAEEPLLVPLAPLDLPLRDARLDGKPAEWGLANGTGGSMLRVDRAASSFVAEWELAGRVAGRTATFDTRLARATVNVLRLRLPADRVLSSDVGLVERDPEEPGAWIVALGSRRRCTLRVTQSTPDSPTPPVVIVDQRARFGLHPEGVRFRVEVDAGVLRGTLSSFAVELPAEARVERVLYGDVPLEHFVEEESAGEVAAGEVAEGADGANSRLHLSLVDPVAGRTRTIVIQGTLPLELGAGWTVPRFALVPSTGQPGAIFVHEQETVAFDVSRQLHAEVLRSDGLRRTSDDEGGIAFSVDRPGAVVELLVSYPDLVMQSDVVSVVDTSEDVWSLRSAIRWRAQTGRAFRLQVVVPRSWRVADVYAFGEVDGTRLTGWRIAPAAGGTQVVSVDMLESLAPSSPRTLFLDLRFDTARAALASVRPVVRPLGCESVDTVLMLAGAAAGKPEVVAGAGFRPIGAAALPDQHRRLTESLLVEPGDARGLYRSRSPDSSVLLVRSTERHRATALVRLAMGESGPVVHHELSAEAGGEPLEFAWSGGDPPGNWSVVGQPGAVVTVEPANPDGSTAEAGNGGTATLWRFVPVGVPAGPVRLVASTPLDADGAGELPVPWAATGFRGTVRVPGSLLERFAVRVEGAVESAAEVDGDREWSYSGEAARISLAGPAGKRDGATVRAATLVMRTVAPIASSGTTEAVFTTLPDGRGTRFEFAMPAGAKFVDCRVDGKAIRPGSVGAGLVVPIGDAHLSHEIVVRSRRAGTGSPRPALLADVPVTATEIVEATWEVALPPDWISVESPRGSRLESLPPPPTWTTRLFGPLGRRADDPVFHPLDRATWWPGVELVTDTSSLEPAWVPAGWTVWRARGIATAGEVALVVSNRQTMQALGWMSLVVCLGVGAVLRQRRWPGRVRLGAAAVLVLFAASWLVPDDLVVVVGGGFAGVLAAFGLPRFLLRRGELPAGERFTEGSTTSFRRLVTGAVVWGAFFGGAASNGQTALDAPPDDAPRALIPESGDGGSAIVYVSRSLLARVEEFERESTAPPRFLLRKAAYEARLSVRGTPEVLVRFDIVPLVEGPLRIELPLRAANPGGDVPCRVNGVETPIETTDDPATIAVVVPARGSRPGETCELELSLHPAVSSSATGRSFTMSIPPVASALLVVIAETDARTVEVAGARGLVTGDENRLEALLGPAGTVEVSWGAGDHAIARPREVRVDVHALATVSPALVRLATRLKLTGGGPIAAAEWDFPPAFVVDGVEPSVEADVELATTTEGTRLRIAPRATETAEFLVDVEFVLLAEATAEGVRLPSLGSLVPASIAPESSTVVRGADRVGVAAGAAHRVRSARLESGASLRNLSMDAFRSAAGGWAVASPEVAFALDEPTPVLVDLALRTPIRATRQRVEHLLTATESTWTYTADVDVLEAPVFAHRIELPRSAVVESVSVLRDGVERTRNWERGDERLEIELDDRSLGPQRIVVRGWLPTDAAGEVSLPAVRLLDADTTRTEIAVFHASDVLATLDEPAVVDERAAPLAEPVEAGEWTPLCRVEHMAGDPVPLVRVAPRDPRLVLATLTTVEPGDGDRPLRVRTRMQIDSPGGPWGRLRVRVPPGFVARDILVDEERTRVVRAPGGPAGNVALVSRRPSSTRAEVTFVCEQTSPSDAGDGTLAFGIPALAEPAATERHWLLPPDGYRAVGDVSPVDASEVAIRGPDPLDPLDDPARTVLRSNVAAGRGFVWRLQPAEHDGPARVPLLEHRLVVDAAGVAGTTFVQFVGQADELVVDAGEGRRRRVRSVVVDGRATEPAIEGTVCRVPLDPAAPRSLVRIDWVDPDREPGWWGTPIPLPRVRDVVVDRALVRIEGPRGGILRVGSTAKPVSAVGYSLDRLEGLLEAAAGRPVPSWLAAHVRGELERLDSRLESLAGDESFDPTWRPRYSELVERLERVVIRAETDPGVFDTQTPPAALLARLPADADAITVGVVPRWILLAPIPLVLVAGLWLLLRTGTVAAGGEAFHAHPSIPLAVAGVVWWIGLRASGIGLVLVMAAAVLVVLRRPARGDRSELVV